MKNKNIIILCVLVGILIIVVLYTTSKSSKKEDVIPNTTTPQTQTKPKDTSTKTYPVGSYSVFITQTGGIGSVVQPKVKVYNASTGSELKPADNYIYYMFFAKKTSGDTLSSYCSLNSLSSFHPVDIKSTSGNSISYISKDLIVEFPAVKDQVSSVPNPQQSNPKSDNSINMFLDKDENDLSFVCIPW